MTNKNPKFHKGDLNPNYNHFKVDFDYNTLYNLYIIQGKTTYDIAKIYSISPATILKHLKRLKIKTRKSGYIINNDIRDKLSKSHKGIKQSFEWRKKRGESIKGEKNPNYKHGLSRDLRYLKKIIRNSFEYKEWRKNIFERDNYTCQWCGLKNGNGKTIYLEAHHIKSFWEFPKLIYDISNGLTLCKKCHNKTKGGNFRRDGN